MCVLCECESIAFNLLTNFRFSLQFSICRVRRRFENLHIIHIRRQGRRKMSFIKQHIALIFVILVCVVCTIESHDRGSGSSSSGGGGSSSGRRRGDKGSGGNSASMVTSLCEKDADMKIACHCTHDHYKQRINEVDCLILHKELSHTDPAWRAFAAHTNIKNLMLTVTRNGYMGYLPIALFRNQRELNSVIIHYGNIREIPAFAFGNQTKLQNISLEKNQIEVLNEFAFANLIELHALNLDDNQIVNISQFAFANLTALTELTLSKNNLTTLHNELFTDMVNLRRLKLNENMLTVLGRDIFKGLGKLQQLDLSYNMLKSLGDAVFTELWSLQELYLDSNNLEVSLDVYNSFIRSNAQAEVSVRATERWSRLGAVAARRLHSKTIPNSNNSIIEFWCVSAVESSIMIPQRRLIRFGVGAQQTIFDFHVRTHRIGTVHYYYRCRCYYYYFHHSVSHRNGTSTGAVLISFG